MTEQKETNENSPAASISEAERMAKIRELLMGPVIADESARVDESVGQLNHLLKEQQDLISALQARVRDLEESQRVGMRRLRLRLMGMVEALLASEDDVRLRLSKNEVLSPKLEDDDGSRGA